MISESKRRQPVIEESFSQDASLKLENQRERRRKSDSNTDSYSSEHFSQFISFFVLV